MRPRPLCLVDLFDVLAGPPVEHLDLIDGSVEAVACRGLCCFEQQAVKLGLERRDDVLLNVKHTKPMGGVGHVCLERGLNALFAIA